ncbi:MAG: hypothetical protein AMJ90_08020 [candidate division Zixibacteria bacterium SM23_73_2]|nr:MAG: hypothetical protein AMJ90_08020 [candidate division Zixibacteria bacterium SM23_73_2]
MVNTQDLDERVSKCQKILEQDPDSQIFAALSEALRRKGELDKATTVCQKGFLKHPDYGSAHLVMAKINFDKKLYSEAEKELNLAVQADGRTRTIELLLAQILLKKGEVKEAKSILKKLNSTDPHNLKVRQLLKDAGEELKKPKKRGKEKAKFIPPPIADIGKRPEEKITLSSALEELILFPQITNALVVGTDGLVAQVRSKEKEDEVIGPSSSYIFSSIQKELPRIDFGDPLQITVESKNYLLWIIKLKSSLLILRCKEKINFGYLKMRINRLLEKIELE